MDNNNRTENGEMEKLTSTVRDQFEKWNKLHPNSRIHKMTYCIRHVLISLKICNRLSNDLFKIFVRCWKTHCNKVLKIKLQTQYQKIILKLHKAKGLFQKQM